MRALDPATGWVAAQVFSTSLATVQLTIEDLREQHHVYLGVNPRASKNGSRKGVKAVRFLVVDVDDKAHGGHDQALASLGLVPLQPYTVVDSGRGFHAYYRLNQDHPPEDWHLTEHAGRILSRLVGGDAVHDPARVLRAPGSWNLKDGERKAVCVVGGHDVTHSLTSILALGPPQPEVPPARWPGDQASPRVADVRELLTFIPPTLPYSEWLGVVAAVHHLFPDDIGLGLATAWSDDARWENGQRTLRGQRGKWASFSAPRPGQPVAGYGTLVHLAKQHGWTPPLIDPGLVRDDLPGQPAPPAPPDPPDLPPPLPPLQVTLGSPNGRPRDQPPQDRPATSDDPWPAMLAAAAPVTPDELPGLAGRFARHIGRVAVAWPEDWSAFLALSALSPLLPRLALDGLPPTLWFLGLGPQAAGKSRSVDLAQAVVSLAATKAEERLAAERRTWHLLTAGTPEAVVATVAGEYQRLLFVQSEYSGFMRLLERDYMAGMRESLCDLYDGRGVRTGRMKGAVVAEHPAVATLAVTTYHGFRSAGRREDIANGYLSRFLFCLPDAVDLLPEQPPTDLETLGLAEAVQAHLGDLAHLRRARWESSACRSILDDFGRRLGVGTGERRRYEDIELVGLAPGRVLARAIKLAVIIAAWRPNPKTNAADLLVTAGDLALGCGIAWRSAAYARRAYEGLGTSADDQAAQAIWAALGPGPLTLTGLVRHTGVGLAILRPVVEMLAAENIIAIDRALGHHRFSRLAATF